MINSDDLENSLKQMLDHPHLRTEFYKATGKYDEVAKLDSDPRIRHGYYQSIKWSDPDARRDYDQNIRLGYYEYHGWIHKCAGDDPSLIVKMEYFKRHAKDKRAKNAEDFRIRLVYYTACYHDLDSKFDDSNIIKILYYGRTFWQDYDWYKEEELLPLGFSSCNKLEINEDFYKAFNKLCESAKVKVELYGLRQLCKKVPLSILKMSVFKIKDDKFRKVVTDFLAKDIL